MARSVSNPIVSERLLLAACLALGCFAAPISARADAKQCIASNEKGNTLRKEGKLAAARDAFAVCAVESCPKMIREECGRLLTQVNGVIPSLVFAVKDASGNDTSRVKVSIDGVDVAQSLDGRGIPVDPGEHRVVLTAEDGSSKEFSVVAREGEQNRRVDVDFQKPQSEEVEPTAPATEPSAPAETDQPTKSGPPVAAWILGGVGVVALGGFAYFALDGKKKENDLESECAPNCPQSDVDDMRKSYLFADIALGVSVVSLGAATYLFLTSSPKKQPSAGVGIPSVKVSPRSAGLTWGGTF
jgi:hypothetical protein